MRPEAQNWLRSFYLPRPCIFCCVKLPSEAIARLTNAYMRWLAMALCVQSLYNRVNKKQIGSEANICITLAEWPVGRVALMIAHGRIAKADIDMVRTQGSCPPPSTHSITLMTRKLSLHCRQIETNLFKTKRTWY